MLRLHGVPPHVAGMLLTGWGATEQNGASVLVLRVGRPPTPPHPAAAALAPHLPPLDMLSTQPLLGPGPLPAHQDTWVGPPLGAIAQLTALTVGMAVPGAAGELPGMVRLAAVPTPDLQLPPILLAPPENQRPPCRASWEVKPLEFYTRLRRGERIRVGQSDCNRRKLQHCNRHCTRITLMLVEWCEPRGLCRHMANALHALPKRLCVMLHQGDRMPLEPRLHREHLHGGWGLRRLFVERDGYVDICTAAWCVYITERAK